MNKPYLRLLVTGSRNFTNSDFVESQLVVRFARAQQAGRGLLIVQGDCPNGPDRFAARWAMEQMRWGAQVDLESHRADWSRGPGEGFRRNERMVRLGAWGVLGFVADCVKPNCTRPRPHGSHGTMHCLKVAKVHDLPIRVWKTKGWQT